MRIIRLFAASLALWPLNVQAQEMCTLAKWPDGWDIGSLCSDAVGSVRQAADGCSWRGDCSTVVPCFDDIRARCSDKERWQYHQEDLAKIEPRVRQAAAKEQQLKAGLAKPSDISDAASLMPCPEISVDETAPSPAVDGTALMEEVRALLEANRLALAKERVADLKDWVAKLPTPHGPDALEVVEAVGPLSRKVSDKIQTCAKETAARAASEPDALIARKIAVAAYYRYQDLAKYYGGSETFPYWYMNLRRPLHEAKTPSDYPHKSSADRAKAFRRALMEERFQDARALLADELWFGAIKGQEWRTAADDSPISFQARTGYGQGFQFFEAAKLVGVLEQLTPAASVCGLARAKEKEEIASAIACFESKAKPVRELDPEQFGSEALTVRDYLVAKYAPLAGEARSRLDAIVKAEAALAQAERTRRQNDPELQRASAAARLCGLGRAINALTEEDSKIRLAGAMSGYVDALRLYRIARQIIETEEQRAALVTDYRTRFSADFDHSVCASD